MQLLRHSKKIRKLDEHRGERHCGKQLQGHGNENRGDQDRGEVSNVFI